MFSSKRLEFFVCGWKRQQLHNRVVFAIEVFLELVVPLHQGDRGAPSSILPKNGMQVRFKPNQFLTKNNRKRVKTEYQGEIKRNLPKFCSLIERSQLDHQLLQPLKLRFVDGRQGFHSQF